MNLFIFKLVITPLFIALITLVARRWGPSVGGWLVGLPLTSGPLSVFLALEQGREFASSAAVASLLSALSVITFCVVYAHIARHASWKITTFASLCIYFTVVAGLSFVTLPLPLLTLLVVGIIALAVITEKPATTQTIISPPSQWEIPFKMITATTLVLLVTTFSEHLGPRLSGLFATFPIFICVLSAFAHSQGGVDTVRQLTHGVISGSFSFVSFFFIVAITIPTLNLFWVYTLAVGTAISVNLMVLYIMMHKAHKTKKLV